MSVRRLAHALRFAVAFAAIALPYRSVAAQAQAAGTRPTLSVVAGPSMYDLAGTGTGVAGGAAVSFEVGRTLVVEPAVLAFTYKPSFTSRQVHLFPEMSAQLQAHLGSWRPYVGVGGGASLMASGSGGSALTLHAALGFRARLTPATGLRGELRVRSVKPWAGTTADVLAGLTLSL